MYLGAAVSLGKEEEAAGANGSMEKIVRPMHRSRQQISIVVACKFTSGELETE
jgi:hypothetical protein